MQIKLARDSEPSEQIANQQMKVKSESAKTSVKVNNKVEFR